MSETEYDACISPEEEQEAFSKGLTIPQLRQMKQIEKEQEIIKQEQYKRQVMESETCRLKYPSFSLEKELANPITGDRFLSLIKGGVDITSAYEVVHLEEIKKATEPKGEGNKASSIKDILVSSLGVLGYIIYFILTVTISFAPLWFLDFSWWVDILIIIAITTIPLLGSIVSTGIWVWSLIIVFSRSVDIFSLIYFACLLVNIFVYVIPFLKSLFRR